MGSNPSVVALTEFAGGEVLCVSAAMLSGAGGISGGEVPRGVTAVPVGTVTVAASVKASVANVEVISACAEVHPDVEV